MTLKALRNQLSEMYVTGGEIAEFKSVLKLYVNAESQKDNCKSISVLKADLTVEMLYQRELLTLSGTLFCLYTT